MGGQAGSSSDTIFEGGLQVIYRRKRKDGSRSRIWSYDFQFRGRHYNGSTGETSKQRAQLVEARIREEIRSGARTGIRDVSFAFLAEEYLRLHASQKKAQSFYRDYVGGLTRHFETTRLSAIRHRDVEEYLVARGQTVKPATVNRSLAILKHMLKKAIAWGYLAENPATRFKPAKESRSRAFFLTAEQANQLLGESVGARVG